MLLFVVLVVIISQWNTLEIGAHVKAAAEWLGPVLYPFYLSRNTGQ